MSRLVLDASVALSWCFEDESSTYSESVLDSLASVEAFAPALWAMEVANTLLLAGRKRRLDSKEVARRVRFFVELSVQIDHVSSLAVFEVVRPLAIEHGLTIYDATYLELALRLKAPLATVDSRLRDASHKHGAFLSFKP